MPELPEVETLRRQLEETILGAVIQDLTILDVKLAGLEDVSGRRVQSVARQGKFLLIGLEKARTLHIHLRMSGRLLWQSPADPLHAHTRFTIDFERGRLLCIDPRRFATLSLEDVKDRTAAVDDPSMTFDAGTLWERARGRKLPVKSFLLDQKIVAGIGNIYVCEMLHRASISPWRSAGTLQLSRWRSLAQAGRDILRRATDCRGTSVSDWFDLYGRKGEYQHDLKVYSREGEPCIGCGEKVQRKTLSGRGTYYCAVCQK
jgi:formamidopyrimidine-DNA glycosylase